MHAQVPAGDTPETSRLYSAMAVTEHALRVIKHAIAGDLAALLGDGGN